MSGTQESREDFLESIYLQRENTNGFSNNSFTNPNFIPNHVQSPGSKRSLPRAHRPSPKKFNVGKGKQPMSGDKSTNGFGYSNPFSFGSFSAVLAEEANAVEIPRFVDELQGLKFEDKELFQPLGSKSENYGGLASATTDEVNEELSRLVNHIKIVSYEKKSKRVKEDAAVGDRLRQFAVPQTHSIETKKRSDAFHFKELADQAHTKADFSRASSLYSKAIDLQPSNPIFYLNRAASRMSFNSLYGYRSAIQDCQTALQFESSCAKAWWRIYLCNLVLGNVECALQALENFSKIDQKSKATQDILFRTNILNSALELKAEIAKCSKMNAPTARIRELVGKVVKQLNIKTYHLAFNWQMAILKSLVYHRDPSSVALELQTFARIVLCDKSDNPAPTHVNGTRILDGSVGVPVKCKGFSVEDIHQIIDMFKLVVDFLYNGVYFDNLRSIDLSFSVPLEDSAKELDTLRQKQSAANQMESLRQEAKHFHLRGEFAYSIEKYSQAILVDEKHQRFNAIMFWNRAGSRRGARQFNEAISDCDQSLNCNPKYWPAYIRRAQCYFDLDLISKAFKDFQTVIDHCKSHAVEGDGEWPSAKIQEFLLKAETDKLKADRRISELIEKEEKNQKAMSHYDVLGLPKTATESEIKRAYKQKAMLTHPDKIHNVDCRITQIRFTKLQEAYDILMDPSKKSSYDSRMNYNFNAGSYSNFNNFSSQRNPFRNRAGNYR